VRKPIILETDFGYKDPYVGIMKGVIKFINPKADILDLTHGIPPFNIGSGAYTLYVSYRYFPNDSIFTVVIDPGVGSNRRPIIAKACGKYFVGPDNGVLYSVMKSCLHEGSLEYIKEIDPDKLIRETYKISEKLSLKVSKTFHGRDIFAPSAALVSIDVHVDDFTSQDIDLSDIVRYDLFFSVKREGLDCFKPIHIDRFGNIALSTLFDNFVSKYFNYRQIEIRTSEGKQFTATLASTFSDVKPGKLLLYSNSFGFLEIAVNQGSASQIVGTPELICFKH
jgi:S-adenosylmethionine hydrolase